MKVECEVEEADLPNDRSGTQPGVIVTCTRCAFAVKVFGTGEASIKRGCVMLREECPEDERNFYEAET